jgi:hypothetical protein
MLVRLVFASIAVFIAVPASAQIITMPNSISQTDYGSDDLGRAMRICASKEIPSTQAYGVQCLTATCDTRVPITYPDEWKACYRVRARWSQSEAARKERQRLDAIERDRQLVERVAGEGQ